MISNTFKEPNFSCKVEDRSGREYEWITFARSESQLRERLEKIGYTVMDIRPYDLTDPPVIAATISTVSRPV